MIRLALLLFISFGVLQAAQQSPPPFDENDCSQQYQSLQKKSHYKAYPAEHETATRLKVPRKLIYKAVTVGAITAALLGIGVGFFGGWAYYSCAFY